MKLKMTLLALVTAVLLCGTFAFVAVADADLELVAGSVSCGPGETVTITIDMEQNPGIYYLGLYLDYDTSALTLKSVKNESSLMFMSGIQHIWYANGIDNYTGTGTLATLTFTVNENAADGEYEIGILTDWAECYNIDEDSIRISFTKGTVKVCRHLNTVTKIAAAPSCTAEGESITYCADCGNELSRNAIEALGHTPGNWTVIAEPTCTEDGVQIQNCSVCGETVEKGVIPATGHTDGEWKVIKAATCTEEGVQSKFCSVCDAVVETEAIPAKGHGESCCVEVKTPTCTEAGENWNVCLDCDAVLSIESVPALGHTPGDWTTQVKATCTAGGVDVKACAVCGTIVETIATPMIAHSYDNGVVTASPTCAAEGILTFTCRACSHAYTESISKLPHTYDALGICTACHAESALFISVNDVRALVGDTVSVDITLDRNAGAFYLALIIEYDTDALELVSVENGSIFNLTAGQLYIWTATSENITETGTLATLNFVVKENAAADVTYPINIRVYECYDENEESVDACTDDGSVFVYNYIYGDVNGDGRVNGQDTTRLLRYLASYNPATGESSVEVFAGADVNGDGRVNGQDTTRLLRYLASYNPATGESSVTLGPSK